MPLKLFRSTGYSSILAPGESTVALHPGWAVLAASCWVGLACNVALWRELSGGQRDPASGLRIALALALVMGGTCAAVLSLAGWRRTFKPLATLVLLGAAWLACNLWSLGVPVDADLLARGTRGWLFPAHGFRELYRWQWLALMLVLVLPPLLWLWFAPVRRLGGPTQLRVNLVGLTLGVALAAAGGWFLAGLPA